MSADAGSKEIWMGYRFGRFRVPRSCAAALTAAALLASAPAALAATDTWSGGEPLGSPPIGDWSQPTNWDQLPSSYGDDLAFPGLPGCQSSSSACYTTDANGDWLTAANLSIADDVPYLLSGSDSVLTLDPLTGDGLDAAPASPASGPAGAAEISVPLSLGDSQHWSVAGNGLGGGSLSVEALVGAPNTLAVTLSDGGQLYLDGSTHTGVLTFAGADPEAAPTANGELGLFGDINTAPGDGGITVSDLGLQLGHFLEQPGQIGSLSVQDGALALGTSGSGYPGGTQVDGTFQIDSSSSTSVLLENTGSVAGDDYGQLTATGDVSLGGTLTLRTEASSGPSCPAPAPGSVDTFITTSGGTLSGQFSNLPDGALTSITFRCGDGSTASYPIEIGYSSTAVTGTFLASTATTLPGSSPAGSSSGGSNSGGSNSGGAGPGASGSRGRSGPWIASAPVVTAGGVHVRVSCGNGGTRCTATLRLIDVSTTHLRGRLVRRTILLGIARTTVAAGEQRVSAVTLNATGRRMLARQRVLRAELVLQRTVGGHVRTLSSRRVTLHADHRRRSTARHGAA